MDKNTFDKYWAKAISYIFNPLIIPFFGIIVILYSNTYISLLPSNAKHLILSIVFTGTFILPLCFVPMYMYLKVIRSIDMEERLQRILPLAITIILYSLTYYFLLKVSIPFIGSFLLSVLFTLIILLILLFKWKISFHTAAIGGLTALILGIMLRLNADIMAWFICSIIASGLVSTARLILEKHSVFEVITGYLTGFFTVFIFIII